jgi:hypothetical protein
LTFFVAGVAYLAVVFVPFGKRLIFAIIWTGFWKIWRNFLILGGKLGKFLDFLGIWD